jgi:hypothetical protein
LPIDEETIGKAAEGQRAVGTYGRRFWKPATTNSSA